jgi:hypothetical protein
MVFPPFLLRRSLTDMTANLHFYSTQKQKLLREANFVQINKTNCFSFKKFLKGSFCTEKKQ